MDRPPETQFRPRGKAWLVWLGGLALAFFLLLWFDDAVELRPDHPAIAHATPFVVIVGGLVAAALFPWRSRLGDWRARIAQPISICISAAILSGLVFHEGAALIEGRLDFPPARTQTYQALLLIDRAYVQHGKNRSWHIETTPISADFRIEEGDYDSMLAHRPALDTGTDPDEVLSSSKFCAKVTIQQSGSALRVLHAGHATLPAGTVAPCPLGAILVGQGAAIDAVGALLRPLGGGLYVLS